MRQMMSEFIGGSVTESGANTYTQGECVMPIIREQDAAVFIHKFSWATTGLDVIADADQAAIQLTKQSKTALQVLGDYDTLYTQWVDYRMVTSGMIADIWPKSLEDKYPFIVLEDKLYIGCKSVGQGAAKSYYYRIYYTIEPITFKQMVRGSSRRL